MKPIDRPKELKRYYQNRSVADTYMKRRTAQPLNGVVHRRQIAFLNRIIGQRMPRRVLEIACGPGRLTAAVRGLQRGVAVDSSIAMLETAQQRMNGAGSCWSFLRTDAFVLPFQSGAFDAVYMLRFVRHFQLADRQRLYAEIQRVLCEGGVFMVDALNHAVSYPSRLKRGLERYPIYDVLYQRAELEAELQAAGFRVIGMEGIIHHYRLQRPLNQLRRAGLDAVATAMINLLEYIPGRQPWTWMVVCEKP